MAFQAALADHGLKLAQGKRVVVIDSNGKVYSLSRHIEGATAKDIRHKLADLKLPDLDEAKAQSEKGKESTDLTTEPRLIKKRAGRHNKEEPLYVKPGRTRSGVARIDAAIPRRRKEVSRADSRFYAPAARPLPAESSSGQSPRGTGSFRHGERTQKT